ncbi:Chloramphenicol acetyltransferase [invertebrate metagenome]|uniref:Chloramphenicol acetyltransferase n=1 Tax=invertebrate metagenome TaxID=1711999 RepID=A0A2H9TCH2_9ZZZZ
MLLPDVNEWIINREEYCMNFFESPFIGKSLKEQVTNPNIIVGDYSYYSGYYHGHSFDECARYLSPDRNDVDKLVIGKFCSIGSGAVFMMAGNQGHRKDWASTFPFFYQDNGLFGSVPDGFERAGDTVVGNDVWIGSEAMIMPGVTLGDGAIIASRALVTKPVPAYTIVGGNPAKTIRQRFSDREVGMLEEMHWWTLKEEQIAQLVPFLSNNDIEGLYDFWKSSMVS